MNLSITKTDNQHPLLLQVGKLLWLGFVVLLLLHLLVWQQLGDTADVLLVLVGGVGQGVGAEILLAL